MNPNEVLGIRRNASKIEVELAYKGRRSQYHPDRYASEDAATIAWATTMMQQVNEAYALLSNSGYRPEGNQGDEDVARGKRNGSSRGASTVQRPVKDLASILFQPNWNWDGLEKIFGKPNIPRDKLKAAIASYAWEVKPGEVLVLVDDTLFGGAKEGILVTGNAIYCKQKFEDSKKIPFTKISKIEPLSNSRMAVNGVEFFDCNVVDHGEFGMFAARLGAACKLLESEEVDQEQNDLNEEEEDGPDEGLIERVEEEMLRHLKASKDPRHTAAFRLMASMISASSKVARMLEKNDEELSEEEDFVVNSDLFRFEVLIFILSDVLATIQSLAGHKRALNLLAIMVDLVIFPIMYAKVNSDDVSPPSEQEQLDWVTSSPLFASFKMRVKEFGEVYSDGDSVRIFIENIQSPIMLELYGDDERESIAEVLGDLVDTIFDTETVAAILGRIQRLLRTAAEKYVESDA